MHTFYDPYQEHLAHHGILGQKWGVRRYQNADGTLTEEGKRRYYTKSGGLTDAGAKYYRKSGKGTQTINDLVDLSNEFEQSNVGRRSKQKRDEIANKLMKADDGGRDYQKLVERYNRACEDHAANEADYVIPRLLKKYGSEQELRNRMTVTPAFGNLMKWQNQSHSIYDIYVTYNTNYDL